MQKTILIVDDEADIRNLVREILEDEGYATLTAANSKEVYKLLETHQPDLAILDIWLRESAHDGLQILETLKGSDHKAMPVIMISGHGTIETAVSAIKQGAYDFVEKPFKSDRLLLMVKRGLETSALVKENAMLKQLSQDRVVLLGNSVAAKQLRERIQAVSLLQSRVLIEGPFGGNMDDVACLIHTASDQAHEPFLTYFCAAQNVDNSLDKVLQSFSSGVLYLSGSCSLSDTDQRVLLAHLQELKPRVRIVSSVLDSEALLPDLYQRLAVEHIKAPELSALKKDILDYADYYLALFSARLGKATPKIDEKVKQALLDYHWPGNFEELKAAIIHALVSTREGEVISLEHLPNGVVNQCLQEFEKGSLDTSFSGPLPVQANDLFEGLPLREAREVFEREYLTSQIERFEGNISKTAEFIGMERSALHRKIKSLQKKADRPEAADQEIAVKSSN